MGKARQKVGQLGVGTAELALALAPGAAECARAGAHGFLGSGMEVHAFCLGAGSGCCCTWSLCPAPRVVLPSSFAC